MHEYICLCGRYWLKFERLAAGVEQKKVVEG